MDRIPLHAVEREIFGKKLKKSRLEGRVPANVYGKGLDSEAVFIKAADFHRVFKEAGETGVIDLRIGTEKVKPVMVRNLSHDPVRGLLQHVDFYQVDLNKTVNVYVPIELIGEEDEKVHLGEIIILNPVSEVEVEALPGDLVDKIEVDITNLHNIDDAITVAELKVDRSKITILTPEEEVVVKIAPAVTEEMQALMEEQDAEAAAAVEAEAAAEGDTKESEDGEESTEGSAETTEESEEKAAE
jgi:large subunit ribosomal protein L25